MNCIHVRGPLGDPDSGLCYGTGPSFGVESPRGNFDGQSGIESSALHVLGVWSEQCECYLGAC